MHVPSSIFCSAMALMPKSWASLRSAVDFSIVGHRNKPLLRWQLRSPRPSLESLDPPAKNEQADLLTTSPAALRMMSWVVLAGLNRWKQLSWWRPRDYRRGEALRTLLLVS